MGIPGPHTDLLQFMYLYGVTWMVINIILKKCISSFISVSLPILEAWVDTRHWICLQLELLHPIEELHFLIWQPSIRQKSIESLSSQHSGGRIGKKDVPAAAAITIFFFPASI